MQSTKLLFTFVQRFQIWIQCSAMIFIRHYKIKVSDFKINKLNQQFVSSHLERREAFHM